MATLAWGRLPVRRRGPVGPPAGGCWGGLPAPPGVGGLPGPLGGGKYEGRRVHDVGSSPEREVRGHMSASAALSTAASELGTFLHSTGACSVSSVDRAVGARRIVIRISLVRQVLVNAETRDRRWCEELGLEFVPHSLTTPHLRDLEERERNLTQ